MKPKVAVLIDGGFSRNDTLACIKRELLLKCETLRFRSVNPEMLSPELLLKDEITNKYDNIK